MRHLLIVSEGRVRGREVRIQNFRSLLNVVVPIDSGATVIIGENNAGKSVLLDALRIALPQRGISLRNLCVSDYDFHVTSKDDDPHTSAPIRIEFELRESASGEWSSNLVSELNEVIQTGPDTDIDYLYFQMVAQYSAASKSYEGRRQFLDASRQPQTQGRAASQSYFRNFAGYLTVFYLSALRDAGDEFSTRSQFWGPLLKAIDRYN